MYSKLIFTYMLLMLLGCDNPIEPNYKKAVWIIPLEESAHSPMVMDDKYIYFNGSFTNFYKIEKASGNKSKVNVTPTNLFGSPSLFDSTIYNGTRGGALHSINPKTLSIIWTKYGFQWTVITAADEFALYVTEENRISALQKSDGSLIWSTEIIGKNAFNPEVNNDRIYFVTGSMHRQDGYFYCLNKYSGEVVYRKTIPYYEDKSQFGGSSSGVGLWNDNVYVSSDNRYLYCFNKETGDSIWTYLMDAPSETPPRISEGIVYTGTLNRTCYAINASNGNFVWSYQTVGSISRIPPQFYSDKVVFISGAIIICDKKTGKLIHDISSRTGDKYGYISAIWDSDGKMYLTAFENPGDNFAVIAYQF